ncbi:hypothetical protein KBW81_04680 [Loktanella salsilacus]|uniref:hypothetical protein n=1 Tax=Loktanella salsilacus TaxID=195913 RepID=UPI0020B6F7AA|nr:hypothetical protein [Loktanella salsilacus]UTH49091.1 hypothetical protein KBW81_04680 [Loktanella salsilacus]
MTDPHTRLTRRNGKWHIIARKVAHCTAQAVYTDIGGCTCPVVAVRLWLATLTGGKR